MEDIKNYIVIIVGLATTISIGFSIYYQQKSFNFQKSKENENELFKLKLEAYSKILSSLNSLQKNIYDSCLEASEQNSSQQERDNLADFIDDEIDKFDNLVIEMSLYFSENVGDSIDKLIDLLYTDFETLMNNNYTPYYDKLLKLCNMINDEVREELQLEKLNHNLYKRNKGN